MGKKFLKRAAIAITITAALAAGAFFLKRSDTKVQKLQQQELIVEQEEEQVRKDFKKRTLPRKTAAKKILQLREKAKEIAETLKEEQEKQEFVRKTENDLQQQEEIFYFWEQDFQEGEDEIPSMKKRLEEQRERLQGLTDGLTEFKEARKQSAFSQYTKESLRQSVEQLRKQITIRNNLLAIKTRGADQRLEKLVEHIDILKALQDPNLQDYISRLKSFAEEALEIAQQLENAQTECGMALIDLEDIERQLR